ncbi:MAG: MMPL family transporter [Vitreimonas sp.]
MRGWGAILCALWCVVACAVIGVRVQGGRAFDTDIQSLLPQNALEPVVRAAIADAGGAASSRVAILISGEDFTRVGEARADLQRALEATGFFTPDGAEGEAFGRWLYANRDALLCERDPARFDGDATIARANALLYSPLAPVSGQLLASDPFLRTLQLAQCLQPAGAPAGDAVLVSGRLNASAFRLDVQDAIAAAADGWRARYGDLHIARAGAVFFAEEGARRARGEVSLIAGVSMAAVLALLLVCFRRPQAIAGTLAVTAAGAVGSLAAAMLVFPSVHILVFVFGSALIGITSDYALHYLATGPQTGWAPVRERVRQVSRPLAVCALGTSLGFASLGVFGVDIFNQVAVFSVAGVLTAWWFTLTLLPLMDRTARKPEQLSALWRRIEAPLLAFTWTRGLAAAGIVAVLAIFAAGALRFGVLDDVRQFQPRSPALTREEQEVRDALGFSASPVFLLSYGASADEAREREEAVLSHWPEDAVRDALAVSRFDPSSARRVQNEAVLRERLYQPHLAAHVRELGLTPATPAPAGEAPRLPPTIGALAGNVGQTHYLVAPLGAIAAGQDVSGEGAMRVDPAARYTSAFQGFRMLAAGAVAAAFAICALIVLALYRRWRALTVLAAPALGAAIGIAVPSALGMPISFFSVAALFVVIGAGIDHSVFLFESAETDGQPKELVVLLAALTTILSMGLLGLSSTYPVASFGVVIAAGVTGAYLFSFVPARVGGRGLGADKQD